MSNVAAMKKSSKYQQLVNLLRSVADELECQCKEECLRCDGTGVDPSYIDKRTCTRCHGDKYEVDLEVNSIGQI